VPFDVAFSLSAADRTAFVIALGGLEGHSFDWNTYEWLSPKAAEKIGPQGR
jgi:hypothetical protein